RAAAEAAAATAEEEEEGELPLTERILAMLWAGRLFIVTGLLLIAAISAYGYLKPRATSGNAPPLTFAAMGEKVTAAGWQYSVVSVERPVKVGTTPATTGGYLIVHVPVSRKDPGAPVPAQSGFVSVTRARA